jgi:hypothetical protein
MDSIYFINLWNVSVLVFFFWKWCINRSVSVRYWYTSIRIYATYPIASQGISGRQNLRACASVAAKALFDFVFLEHFHEKWDFLKSYWLENLRCEKLRCLPILNVHAFTFLGQKSDKNQIQTGPKRCHGREKLADTHANLYNVLRGRTECGFGWLAGQCPPSRSWVRSIPPCVWLGGCKGWNELFYFWLARWKGWNGLFYFYGVCFGVKGIR